ncbi:hypothetical protein [Marinifilum flexuosum]|uniref:hypothetical protein n=1 Tax=Marinifilum flexuosum TaxID=1117708 RepID=UPI00248F8B65|nr:hypothetical protein [Marinifilum flexuosum]
MKKRHVIFLALLLCSLAGCYFNPVKQHLFEVSAHIVAMKTKFGKDYLKPNLLSHFPNEIKDTTNLRLHSSPPSCPPSFECRKQFGEVYLITTRDTITEKWIKENYLYKTEYQSEDNIIINLPELKFDRFPIEKCNKEFNNKYPIPYFESYDFNLGEKEFEKIIDGEKYWDYVYTIPNDLEVYVIQGESGNYWKKKCNENRPETLKKWKNGYSKGIAVSKEKEMMIYWIMVW